jgi:hypothetical protein
VEPRSAAATVRLCAGRHDLVSSTGDTTIGPATAPMVSRIGNQEPTMILDVLIEFALLVLVITALIVTSAVLLSIHPSSPRQRARNLRRRTPSAPG